jgi:hypothetical protein
MLTARSWVPVLLIALLLESSFAWAAESHKSVQILARILPRASLTLDRSQITFEGYEDQAVIPALAGPLKIMAKGRGSRSNPLTLTVRADADLTGAAGRIPVQQVQWHKQGPGFISGALNRGHDQLVALWTGGGVYRGGVEFYLQNNNRLTPGDYRGSVTLTLASP